MLTIDAVKGVSFDSSLCQQCGACVAVCPVAALSAIVADETTGLSDIRVNHDVCIKCGKCVATCPSNKLETYNDYFETLPQYTYHLMHNSDPAIRRYSSSGGVARTFIVEALRDGLVDGVYTLSRTEKFPYVGGKFWSKENVPHYEDFPNSVYHSVLQCSELYQVRRCRTLMIVGTSCQIRALKVALRNRCEKMICVAIFCKQQKHLGATRFLAKVAGAGKIGSEFKATYRGDGWPGTVTVNGHSILWSRAAQIPFGRRLWSVPGCNVCGDPFGIKAGADISLMDPWEICSPGPEGDTLVTTLTDNGHEFLSSLGEVLVKTPLSYADALPALGLTDIRRKQQLVPFYRGDKCNNRISVAGKLDKWQRGIFGAVMLALPRMPMLFYRIACKIPDPRNIILK